MLHLAVIQSDIAALYRTNWYQLGTNSSERWHNTGDGRTGLILNYIVVLSYQDGAPVRPRLDPVRMIWYKAAISLCITAKRSIGANLLLKTKVGQYKNKEFLFYKVSSAMLRLALIQTDIAALYHIILGLTGDSTWKV